MLYLDLLGLGLTVGGLLLLFGGRRTLVRAVVAVALGEVGRLCLALLLGGRLLSLTLGGAFTRINLAGVSSALSPDALQVGGLLAGAVLGLPLGRRRARDAAVYAVAASVASLWLSG